MESHSACSETAPAKATYIHPAMKDDPGNRHQPTRSWSMKKGRALGLLFAARKITLIRDHITPKYHTVPDGWTGAKPPERIFSGGRLRQPPRSVAFGPELMNPETNPGLGVTPLCVTQDVFLTWRPEGWPSWPAASDNSASSSLTHAIGFGHRSPTSV